MIFSHLSKAKRMFASVKTKFIDYKQGPPDNLFVNERDISLPEDYELMRVKAVGINRAQCLHRVGKYAIKNEAEKHIGLQASGQVIDANTGEKKYDGIALLSGGSYAQYAAIPKTHVMKLPQGLSYRQGAAIPEAWITAFLLLELADLKPGNRVVIYAGASGVGTACIQICHILGFQPHAVVSTPQKGEICKKLGVKNIVYYKDNENWADQLISAENGKLFNAVLDCVGSSNIEQTVKLLDVDGAWILYGLLSGFKAQMNLSQLLFKRIRLISTTLKTRSKEYKDNLIKNFCEKVLKEFQTKKALPVIGQVFECNWQSSQSFVKAHTMMQSNQNIGKIIIEYTEDK